MGYFVSQIRKYLRSRGRKINVGAPRIIQSIGWTITFAAAIFIIYTAHTTYKEHVEGDLTLARRLSGRNDLCTTSEDEDNCPTKAPHVVLIIPLIIGTLYLFVAIAIVCDEFFVPALEEIGDSWGISDDVAGATLMAAGGSAPELAASMIGTFTGSSVGFGTIVGSAVFNVLFVIACCVVFTPEEFSPLELTAWPLARDCTYYCLCLTMIAVFFGASSPGVIEGWEAACLFCLYLGYVTLMTFNEQLYEKFNGCKIATEQQEVRKWSSYGTTYL
jgi:sodium/potassium/calcium exchanger 2